MLKMMMMIMPQWRWGCYDDDDDGDNDEAHLIYGAHFHNGSLCVEEESDKEN